MKPILTAEEYRRVDQAYTGDMDQAMDRAGFAVATAAARHGAGYGRRVVVLAGPGNNGGDGYVAARYLKRRGAAVEIHALAEPRAEEAVRAASLAREAGVVVRQLGAVVEADLVIDALFGGGGRGGLSPEVLAWMDTPAPVVAVDYPTGLDPSTGGVEERAFRAVETVTFGTLKTGHVRGGGPDHCGEVTVADIGIEGGEPSMWLAEEADAPRPGRPRRMARGFPVRGCEFDADWGVGAAVRRVALLDRSGERDRSCRSDRRGHAVVPLRGKAAWGKAHRCARAMADLRARHGAPGSRHGDRLALWWRCRGRTARCGPTRFRLILDPKALIPEWARYAAQRSQAV